jgi:hypothetical protein
MDLVADVSVRPVTDLVAGVSVYSNLSRIGSDLGGFLDPVREIPETGSRDLT